MIFVTFGNPYLWFLGVVLLTAYAGLRWQVGLLMTDDRRYWLSVRAWLRPQRPEFELGWWSCMAAAFLALALNPLQWVSLAVIVALILYWAWVWWLISQRPRLSRRRFKSKKERV